MKRATAVLVLACVALVSQLGSTWVAQAQAPAPSAAAARPNPQGGTGAIKVALVTKGHAYDREGLNLLFDSLGEDIAWSHVEHPAAALLWDPKAAALFDVFVFFDAPGRTQRKSANGAVTYDDPGPDAKKNLAGADAGGNERLGVSPSRHRLMESHVA